MKIIRQNWLPSLIAFLSIVASPIAQADEQLSALINERLSYMKAVAAYKWLNELPIEDLEREATVIATAQRSGLDHGITVDSSETFFQAQITAAKEIQSYWYAKWELGEGPTAAPDLNKEVRPALLKLGHAITANLGTEDVASDAIQATGLSNQTAAKIAHAANDIQTYPNTLEQVLDSGVLRVGTTWDYAPFSSGGKQDPRGIDIDMAYNLANSLDAELEFVTTSWPTLMQDFSANQYDIGMSGISINLKRQRLAYFTLPYHSGGKTPIVRCKDVERFNNLEKIDQPDTRMVVNPGGTNERFARANIENAQLRIHDDNRTIFDEIIAGRADVMITDQIEVTLQSNTRESLCAAMPNQTLTFQQKGYLLPQDEIFKQYVDTWLNQRIGDGTLEQTFKQHQAH